MIYPQKISSKNTDKIIKILVLVSIALGVILFLINRTFTPNIPWSPITNAGIIYIWITVIYSIKRNANIAAHVLLQMIIMSLLLLYIDDKLSFRGWSIYIGIPIILMIANLTMLILAIVSYKKYTRYAIYQLIIVLISMIPIILLLKGFISFSILHIIAIGISLINFSISLALSYKDFYKTLICKFHI